MKIVLDGTEYQVLTDNNDTVADIVAAAPLRMRMVRYDGHEYYDTLPFTPRVSSPQTSRLLAGHIYYWAGGNSFVINFKDYDIAPYKSVHVGEFQDAATIADILRDAPDKISITIEK